MAGSSRTELLLFLLLLTTATTVVRAAFTRDASFRFDWVRKHPSGSFCFHPGSLSSHTPCTDIVLSALLDAHINNDHGPGLSIMYYSTHQQLALLGGVDWSDWNTTSSPVGICQSGVVTDIQDAYLTTCRFATRDDDHNDPFAHARECSLDRPQHRVADGCYSPPAMSLGFQLSNTTTSVLTIFGVVLSALVLPRWVAAALACLRLRRARRRHPRRGRRH
ncbi:hypothetical protein BKA62DRAFT_737356 [Auriculariales sp. MPI-PUGE-AT-0066]|nr:hypothetical protein BKA62DRAFT_737356 [Auriculariales sp. MPI-PUGE-AT-0066]